MTSFLFIVSFLLHIVLLIVVFYLYQHIQTLTNNQTYEIENLLKNFLQQMKLENQKIENKIYQKHLTTHQSEEKYTQIKEKSQKSNESSYELPPNHMEESNV